MSVHGTRTARRTAAVRVEAAFDGTAPDKTAPAGTAAHGAPRRRRRTRAVLGAALALATLAGAAGCAGLPTSSTVVQDTNPATGDGGADIRVWPQPPARGDSPRDIVEGFLQTAASDPSNLRIAMQYLTSAAAKSWDPSKVVVFGDESPPEPVFDSPGDFQIVGPVVGKVTDSGSYIAGTSSAPAHYIFHVTGGEKQGYRIDSLPSDFGIALQQEVFRSDYAEYNLYYLNDDAPTQSMIPVPLYLRSQNPDATVATQLASALFHDMPTWLGSAGRLASNAPALDGPVTISQDDVAHVVLAADHSCDGHAAQASVSPQSAEAERVCDQLADELLATFDGVASINAVDVRSPGGSVLGSAADADAVMRQYHIEGAGSKQPLSTVYYLDTVKQQVMHTSTPEPSASPIGPASSRYSRLAVTTLPGASSVTAALVDSTGSKLYLGTPGDAKVGDPVFTGQDVTSLSWDALGHLWFVADQDGTPTVFRLDPTASPRTPPQVVPVLGELDGPVQRICVAPDGRRVALSYGGAQGTSIAIGIADHDGPGWSLDFDYPGAQPLVSQWSEVADLCWRGSQVLTVLGTQQQTSSPTVYEFYPDGSPVVNATDLSTVMITPPKDAVAIAWAADGSTLLAASRPGGSSGANASPDPRAAQIEVYSTNSALWSPLVAGSSPAPQN